MTSFTDGCPGLRCILTDAGVTKPPILDWFHIAMRMQHTAQAASGLSTDTPVVLCVQWYLRFKLS